MPRAARGRQKMLLLSSVSLSSSSFLMVCGGQEASKSVQRGLIAVRWQRAVRRHLDESGQRSPVLTIGLVLIRRLVNVALTMACPSSICVHGHVDSAECRALLCWVGV
jgi:hypothetical protein